MATVTKPIALDESINTTESPSRNLADVLAQELSGIASAITGGSDKVPKTDVATIEPSTTASRSYSVGELVYVNGSLYKVIASISQGSTFTVGTNIQSTTVSGVLEDVVGDTNVYKFFNDKAVVTKIGKVVTANFYGAESTAFKSGTSFTPTTFLDNYPELKPTASSVLAMGLLYKDDANNYLASIEVTTSGKVSISYKNALNTRTYSLSDTSFRIYGTLSWINE